VGCVASSISEVCCSWEAVYQPIIQLAMTLLSGAQHISKPWTQLLLCIAADRSNTPGTSNHTTTVQISVAAMHIQINMHKADCNRSAPRPIQTTKIPSEHHGLTPVHVTGDCQGLPVTSASFQISAFELPAPHCSVEPPSSESSTLAMPKVERPGFRKRGVYLRCSLVQGGLPIRVLDAAVGAVSYPAPGQHLSHTTVAGVAHTQRRFRV
jgi:hypothetical protein